MKPAPWSPSSLDDFCTCPYAYYRKRIVKDVKEPPSEALTYGNEVHKHFENRLNDDTPLPDFLEAHEPYVQKVLDRPGVTMAEQSVGLTKTLRPCGFWDKEIWFRAKVDVRTVSDDRAWIIDWKTGKPHQKFKQLAAYALHTFVLYPNVDIIQAEYYWTQTTDTTKKVWARKETKDLWQMFVPDLNQYALAFKEETWQKRPSGLCKKHCAVVDCEFNGQGG